jgi:hypothetical protein
VISRRKELPLTYDHQGVHFLYPENWQVERQETEEGWTIAVQSPGAAFLLISRYDARPEQDEVLQTSLRALKQDYADLETEEAAERIAKHQAIGYDIDFFSLDTINSCTLRSFRTRTSTYLVMTQYSGLDEEMSAAVLKAILVSLQIQE